MDYIGNRYHYGHSGTIIIINYNDYSYEIVREYENGEIVFQKRDKKNIDNNSRYIEKVSNNIIAKYLLLKE